MSALGFLECTEESHEDQTIIVSYSLDPFKGAYSSAKNFKENRLKLF